MDVSVESVSTLVRRVSVTIPPEHVDEEVEQRLKHLASRVNLPGFRPGKAPLHIVKKQYLPSVRAEVAQGLLEETLPAALKKESLSPVGAPSVEKMDMEPGQHFHYVVSFEILPDIHIQEPSAKKHLDWISAEVKPADIDVMLEKLQAQHKTWETVDRAAKMADKLDIDFDGRVDGKSIEQGKAEHFSIELGSHQMIPGFEEALIGHKAGEAFPIEVTFPKDYQESQLAGKLATFDIHIHEVQAGVLPKIDADFIKQFGIESGKLEDFRKDVTGNMTRELSRRLREINHDACFSLLAEANPFELPASLIDKEIEHLKHEMFHRIFGPKHHDHEKMPDFPRELFEDRAKKRVHLGLLFAEYVKKHTFFADPKQVEALIDQIASAYADPDEFKQQCRADNKLMAEVEALVVERLVAEKIRDQVTVKEKDMHYQDVMDKQV